MTSETIGGQDDDEAEADRVRGVRLEAEQLQAARATGSPRLAPEKAPAKIAISVIPLCTVDRNRPGSDGEVERALRAAAAALGHRLQPRLARRDDRQLAHRQHAVERDQREDEEDVEPGNGG